MGYPYILTVHYTYLETPLVRLDVSGIISAPRQLPESLVPFVHDRDEWLCLSPFHDYQLRNFGDRTGYARLIVGGFFFHSHPEIYLGGSVFYCSTC